MSRPDARRHLEQQLKDGKPHPATKPSKLPLAAIREAPELFQFRNPLEWASDAHAQEMAKTAKGGTPLAAILIWWGGNGWYCIDGHHRLEAYRRAKWPHKEPVPVSVYEGSVAQAMLKASGSNSQPKLNMSKAEQTQAAWELVVSLTVKEASARAIARAACVSERYIFAMRKVKETLSSQDPARDLSSLYWHHARELAEGIENPQKEARDDAYFYEEAVREGKRIADLIQSNFGDTLRVSGGKPQWLAHAIAQLDRQAPAWLSRHWIEEGLCDELEQDEDSDF